MNLSTQQAQKQNAIFKSLKKYLAHEELMKAMVIWQQKYADAPGFSVRYFANDVADLASNGVRPKILVSEMVIALSAKNTDLENAHPIIEAYKTKNGLTTKSTAESPEVTALTVLLKKLVELTPSHLQKETCQLVARRIAKTNMTSQLKMQILRWLDNNQYEIRSSKAEISDLRTMLSAAYAGYCESIGPVKTDALFADALSRLESNGAAMYSDIFKQIM